MITNTVANTYNVKKICFNIYLIPVFLSLYKLSSFLFSQCKNKHVFVSCLNIETPQTKVLL